MNGLGDTRALCKPGVAVAQWQRGALGGKTRHRQWYQRAIVADEVDLDAIDASTSRGDEVRGNDPLADAVVGVRRAERVAARSFLRAAYFLRRSCSGDRQLAQRPGSVGHCNHDSPEKQFWIGHRGDPAGKQLGLHGGRSRG